MIVDELVVTSDLAYLNLGEQEMERFTAEVGKMLDFFAKMDELDVSSLEPTTHALLANNRTREDNPAPFNNRSNRELYENAPETEGNLISIPNVL